MSREAALSAQAQAQAATATQLADKAAMLEAAESQLREAQEDVQVTASVCWGCCRGLNAGV